MRAGILIVAAAAALALAAGSAAGGQPGAESSAKTPSRLLVTGQEWSLTLSSPKVKRGPAIIEFYNRGEDPHDLKIRRFGKKRTLAFAELGPGETGRLETRLKRGSRYRLWCSLPSHRERGMKSVLKVSRKRR